MNVLCDLIWLRIDLDADDNRLCYKVLAIAEMFWELLQLSKLNLGTANIVFPH